MGKLLSKCGRGDEAAATALTPLSEVAEADVDTAAKTATEMNVLINRIAALEAILVDFGLMAE